MVYETTYTCIRVADSRIDQDNAGAGEDGDEDEGESTTYVRTYVPTYNDEPALFATRVLCITRRPTLLTG